MMLDAEENLNVLGNLIRVVIYILGEKKNIYHRNLDHLSGV